MRARLGGNALADFELAAPSQARHPFTADTTINAKVRAHIPSLAAAQPWIGTSMRVQGQMIADLAVGGTIGKPALSGQLVGYGLRVDMPQFGVSYRDGQLRMASGPEGINLEELSFNAGDGRFVASGLLGIPSERGAPLAKSQIRWRAENFRATNRPNLRIIVDGEGTLAMEDKRLVLRGKLSADEGNIEYHSTADTTLADDIVVVGRPRPARARPDAILADSPLALDLELSLGRNLRFAGEGLEARLAGRVHVTSKGGEAIQARGTIRTVRGTYHAFGQRLSIERGRILFDGPIANPSLDIVALRKNLPVEAGVEISGTVRAPLVRLTSEPPVPDNEKLAWLLTGGPPGSGTARDSAALSAAAAALAGRGGKPITQRLAQSIGLDDISFSQRDVADGADSVSNEVITLGKRLSDRLYVAYERGVTLATDALRIEYVLSRYFTVSAFAGTSSGVALSFRRNWP
jgi:translocation and assembly module TamB